MIIKDCKNDFFVPDIKVKRDGRHSLQISEHMAQNIKVAIRVRNLPSWHGRDGKKDTEEYNANVVKIDQPDSTKNNINTHMTIGSEALRKEIKEFSFDYVFAANNDQAFLYQNLIDPLIAKCVQGFNGCVFVYGQTASGKTCTDYLY